MNQIKLIAVGDISLQTKNKKNLFEKVKEIFKDKDILFGNLETVLSNQGEEVEKAVTLHTSPKKVWYLREAGFDILNIANNHIMDLGIEGFSNTLDALNEGGLLFVGANDEPGRKYQILEKKGIKLGFVGYTEDGFNLSQQGVWINRIDQTDIIKDIEFIKPQCDFIIISLHWGIENIFYPSPKQIRLAHRLIDAGATVILGHHPHVIQGIERYKHGLIAYSLGNFQFDPRLSHSKTNDSIILCLEFCKKRLENYRIIPIVIDKNFIPTLALNKDRKEILNFLNNISRPITDDILTWNRWFEEVSKEYLSGNMKSWETRIKKYGTKHFLQCIRWLFSLFVIRCYLGFLRRKLRLKEK